MSEEITIEQRLIRMEGKLDKLLTPKINIYLHGKMDLKEMSRTLQTELQRALKDRAARQ